MTEQDLIIEGIGAVECGGVAIRTKIDEAVVHRMREALEWIALFGGTAAADGNLCAVVALDALDMPLSQAETAEIPDQAHDTTPEADSLSTALSGPQWGKP